MSPSPQPTAPLTLYSLSTSRAIRIAFLLEELSLPYTPHLTTRDPTTGLSSPEFKSATGHPLGKSPTLCDPATGLRIHESGAITEYLCGRYDREAKMGLSGRGEGEEVREGQGEGEGEREEERRTRVREWVHAAEGTLMMHALPYIYTRRVDPRAAELVQSGLQALVRRDLEWVEGELLRSGGGWLVGGRISAADTMVSFSVLFILANGLAGEEVGVENVGERFRCLGEWLGRVRGREAWRRAVERTGFQLVRQA